MKTHSGDHNSQWAGTSDFSRHWIMFYALKSVWSENKAGMFCKRNNFLCQCSKAPNVCLFSKDSSLWNKIKNFYAWKIKLSRNSLWKVFQLFTRSIQGQLTSTCSNSLSSRLLCFFFCCCCVNAFSGTCLSLCFSQSGITWRCLSLMLEHYTAATGNTRPCKCHLPMEFKMGPAFLGVRVVWSCHEQSTGQVYGGQWGCRPDSCHINIKLVLPGSKRFLSYRTTGELLALWCLSFMAESSTYKTADSDVQVEEFRLNQMTKIIC